MTRLHSVADYRRAASRRLPRIVFDFLEGGALDELTLAANVDDLRSILLRQRVMKDVADVDLGVAILGRRLRTPILVAPMGLLSLFRPDADVELARAAHAAGSVFVHSAWSGAPLKAVAAAAPGAVWCQASVWPEQRLVDQHLDRAAEAGIDVVVLAGDVAVSSKRDRDLRNGFTMRARPSVRGVLNAALHPRWVKDFVFGPRVSFGDQSIDGRPMTIAEMGAFMEHENASVTWADVDRIRRRWPGKLVVKGVMDPDDARLAIESGVDGIYVSNHGGRQFDAQPSTVAALPAIAAAVAGRADVLFDGGIRRGADVVKARALGADACLVGRPVVYGAIHAGQPGAEAVLALLNDELATALAFVGARSYPEVGPEAIAEAAARYLR